MPASSEANRPGRPGTFRSLVASNYGPVLVALTFFLLTWLTWRKWSDILIDFGRELYVPWRLVQGEVLYRDLACLNGPLSPYLNALRRPLRRVLRAVRARRVRAAGGDRARRAIPMVGASGAIGGVMGAYARLYPRAPVHLLIVFFLWVDRIVVPAFLMLGYWFVIQVLAGIPVLASEAGGVAFWAHVGGFLAGVALVPVFARPERVAAHRALLARRAYR